MHRNSLVELSGRAMHQAVRLALNQAGGGVNDKPMWQELDFSGLFSDGRKLVERIQAFGFSSVPLPPTQKQSQSGGSGGIGSQTVSTRAAGGGGEGQGDPGGQGEPQHAEGIAIFLGGQRNHPVVIAVDDRRHRPMGLKPGENAQYDDIQQMTLMRRNGLYLLSNDNPDAEGKTAERMVSLRHVEKKKQERKPEQRKNIGQQQGGQQSQQEEFKHEGETVNNEVRVTKKKVEFRDGENVKGFYDKQAQHWNFNGKKAEFKGSDNTEIGDKNVKITGSTGIQLLGPTTINGSPAATAVEVMTLLNRIQALELRLAQAGL